MGQPPACMLAATQTLQTKHTRLQDETISAMEELGRQKQAEMLKMQQKVGVGGALGIHRQCTVLIYCLLTPVGR